MPRIHTPAEFTPLEKAFSTYLGQKGIYEKTLWQGLQKLEYLIGQSIAAAAPGTNPNVVSGLIWSNNQINPNTSPQDIEAALDIIRRLLLQKKEGQATVDTWTPETAPGFSFNPTGDEANQPVDPLDSQQIGRSQNEITNTETELPSSVENESQGNIDDRIYEFLKLRIKNNKK